MATKVINLGSFGPFEFDDTDQYADGTSQTGFKTDGDVEANSVAQTGLSVNIRAVYSDANQKFAEADTLTQLLDLMAGVSGNLDMELLINDLDIENLAISLDF